MEIESRYLDLLNKAPSKETHSDIQSLSQEAAKLSLPSLIFALKRLSYWHTSGITSINVAGTMGSGKSSVANYLTAELGFELKDADLFHPQENQDKMASGKSLSSIDRYPFYLGVQNWLKQSHKITSCSALTDMYRAIIAGQSPEVLLDESSALRNKIWEIASPNLGMFPIMVTKPYEIALEELDKANRSEKGYREINGKRHFIQVTYNSEQASREASHTPLLYGQYQLLAKQPVFAWDALVIDSQSLKNESGSYENTQTLSDLLTLLRKFISSNTTSY